MGSTALQQAQLDAANLGAGGLLADICQFGSQTAQLGMTEAVSGGGFSFRDETTIGIVNAFRDSYDTILVLV